MTPDTGYYHSKVNTAILAVTRVKQRFSRSFTAPARILQSSLQCPTVTRRTCPGPLLPPSIGKYGTQIHPAVRSPFSQNSDLLTARADIFRLVLAFPFRMHLFDVCNLNSGNDRIKSNQLALTGQSRSVSNRAYV